MKSNRIWIITAGILGFLGVAIGAFGAHSLKDILSPSMTEVYKTGVQYHLIHSVVILVLGLLGNGKFKWAAVFFTLGIILFSFSLYIYSVSGITAFAIVTPFGGVSFLVGWILIIVGAVNANRA